MSAAETFGHVPVWINAGYCGGCEGCGSVEEREVCARCVRIVRETDQPWGRDLVDWPCMSAVVLGLVPRSRDAALRSSPPLLTILSAGT